MNIFITEFGQDENSISFRWQERLADSKNFGVREECSDT
jgi:hypothetical protein